MIKTLENTPEKKKKGETVWFIEPWTKCIYVGIIEEIKTDGTKEYAWIHAPHFGNTCRMLSDAFVFEEDAREYKRKKEEKMKNDYRDQIHSIQDLVCFMFDHTVSSAEEYTDWTARAVAIEKAKEFGITLDEE